MATQSHSSWGLSRHLQPFWWWFLFLSTVQTSGHKPCEILHGMRYQQKVFGKKIELSKDESQPHRLGDARKKK